MYKSTQSIEVRTRERHCNKMAPGCRGKPPDRKSPLSFGNRLIAINNKPDEGKIYKGETIMEATTRKSSLFRSVALASFAILAAMAITAPKSAHAVTLTSGNATIHNPVTVKFTAAGQTLYNSAVVNVTVATLASVPTVYKPSPQTVNPGASVTYDYVARSTSNGKDTYTFGNLGIDIVSSSISAATSTSITGSFDLWAGYIIGVGAADSNEIKIPAGSESGLTAGTSTIEINIGGTERRYTVTTISAGTVRSTSPTATPAASAATTTPESYTVLTLTPISHSVKADTAAVGTQAGEYKTFTIAFTAGTPSTAGTDGQYDNSFTITTTAKKADNSTAAVYTEGSYSDTKVRTTVTSPKLTITKKSRNVTKGDVAFAASGTTAKPNEVLEYEIVVTNSHPSADATNISISDALPADYVTEKTGVYSGSTDVKIVTVYNNAAAVTTYATFADDADVAYLAANSLSVTLGNGAGDAKTASSNGGTLKKSPDNAIVYFQVTVK